MELKYLGASKPYMIGTREFLSLNNKENKWINTPLRGDQPPIVA